MSKKNIVVIKFAAIGDVLRTTTILPALKNRYPGSAIYWVTTDLSRPILDNNPFIDAVYIESELTGEFRKRNYSMVINLDEDWDACQLASGLKGKKFGYYLKNGRILATKSARRWMAMSLLGGRDRDSLKKNNKHTYQKLMCDIIEIPYRITFKPVLRLRLKEIKRGQDFARQHGIKIKKDFVVGINTSAGQRWPLKEMTIGKTTRLVDKLLNEGIKVILLGGEKERGRNRKIKEMSEKSLIDSGCGNSLREFASIINVCDAVISADTLAMHISIALGKCTVAFFGPTPVQEIEFYSMGTAIVPDMDCLCCMKKVICEKKPNCMDLLDEGLIVKKIIDYRKIHGR